MNLSGGPPTCWAFWFHHPQTVEDALLAIGVRAWRVHAVDRTLECFKANGAYQFIWHVMRSYNLIICEAHWCNNSVTHAWWLSLGLELLHCVREAHAISTLNSNAMNDLHLATALLQ